MKKINKPIVLVAPLDWGLGHATRCIPIIQALLRLDCEVIIATDGIQKALLFQEFPKLTFLQLAGYQVLYHDQGWRTKLKVLSGIPGILTSIRRENQWLKGIIHKYRVNLVISDNRYGLYNKEVSSIFITHQLFIRTSFGLLPDRLLQFLNYRLIKNFNACWVPDLEGENNLAGSLSHPRKFPALPVKYIGLLSRIQPRAMQRANKHILILLSGPEPQRSILENIVLQQLQAIREPIILVRGLPGESKILLSDHRFLKIYNHLKAEEMAEIILEAKVVVCRAGYSSIMDLIPLGIACAFIPTPGQTEQVYLAEYLSSGGLCLYYKQNSFKLLSMLKDLESFIPKKIALSKVAYEDVIRETLNQLIVAG